jgi:hypothetical protein
MRSTQFIGLTDKCKEQVKECRRVETVGWETFGMFSEQIPLALYYTEGRLVAIEYVVACPWSSGPMIFTGLMTPNGPSPYNWEENKSAKGQEFNPTTGKYWI